jgi:hypothetical protein
LKELQAVSPAVAGLGGWLLLWPALTDRPGAFPACAGAAVLLLIVARALRSGRWPS